MVDYHLEKKEGVSLSLCEEYCVVEEEYKHHKDIQEQETMGS